MKAELKENLSSLETDLDKNRIDSSKKNWISPRVEIYSINITEGGAINLPEAFGGLLDS